MAIDPLTAGMAAASLISGIGGGIARMRDKGPQNRIAQLLSQARGMASQEASGIAGSGEGINPALAQRSALEYMQRANREATQSAMAQQAAQAERDRARTDRLTGGILGSIGAFGSQLLAGSSPAAAAVGTAANALTGGSAMPSLPSTGQTPTPALDRLSAELDSEPQNQAASPMPFIAGQRVAPATDRFRGGLRMPSLGQQAGVGQRNFQPRLTGVGGPLTMRNLSSQPAPTSGTISIEQMEQMLQEQGRTRDPSRYAPAPTRRTRQEELEMGSVSQDPALMSPYSLMLHRQRRR